MRHNVEEAIDTEYAHIPVLWREILDFIEDSPFKGSGKLVDCTLGEGGHSALFLKRFSSLHIIAFERDSDVIEIAKKRLKNNSSRIEFINDNFSQISEYSEKFNTGVNYILYDFGISSYHFDAGKRGFAFKEDEVLDMRLNSNQKIDALYILNTYELKKLADVFYIYGGERWAKRIATVICERRKNNPVKTTKDLADLVLGAIPKKFHVKNIHPATRVFQAIRIEVNDELSAIEKSLDESYKYLAPGGRMFAISFHSLEDRIVKNKFRRLSQGCACKAEPKYCICTNKPFVKILTKKPVVPQEDEIEINKRARSSKLRVCEKV